MNIPKWDLFFTERNHFASRGNLSNYTCISIKSRPSLELNVGSCPNVDNSSQFLSF